jgi:aconitate hydratase
MIRGTFANIRLRNQLAAGVTEGGYTRDFTAGGRGDQAFIYDAAQNYQAAGHPAGGAGGQGVRLGLLA